MAKARREQQNCSKVFTILSPRKAKRISDKHRRVGSDFEVVHEEDRKQNGKL
jgi:hypothetical protein